MPKKITYLSSILAPVSLGELIDKITILEIKKSHMAGIKLKNVLRELELLNFILKNQTTEVDINLINLLKEINNRLWEIEDKIRVKEIKQNFDEEFIELARSVYKENDRRAYIKKKINRKYYSGIIEEKLYNSKLI